MHTIEPYYNWRDYYTAEEDQRSPFYKKSYNEFYYDKTIYNYCIHPQWDEFGPPTLYLKILFADYLKGFVIIELLGEWNDCISNDCMYLKRDIADHFIDQGIRKFILIGENILNFHHESDDYYAEWYEDIEDGWIAAVNFRDHVLEEFIRHNIDYYIAFGGHMNLINWRSLKPDDFFEIIDDLMVKRIGQ